MSASMSSPSGSRLRAWWILAGLTVFAWAPTTYPGYWLTLEGFAPIFNAHASGPIAEVAALPDVWRGMGSATFALVRPLVLLGLDPVTAVRAVFGLLLALAALAVYVWLEPRLGEWAAALAGLIYALMPPVLATVYLRGSLADAHILALLPVALAAVTAYRAGRHPAAAGVAVLAVLWMWRAQAGLAVFATAWLLVYTLWVERDRLAGLALAVAALAGFLSLWPLRAVQAPPPVTFADHFLYLFQLFQGDWQLAPSVAGWQDDYPFLLGFPVVAFIPAALWLWWRRHRDDAPPAGDEEAPGLDRFLAACLVLGTATVVLSLGVSAPLWQFTRAERLLTYPWQVILPGLPFLAALAGSLPRLAPALACRGYWTGLMALVLMAGYPYLSPVYTQYTPPERPVAVFGNRGQIVLLEAHLQEIPTGDAQGRATLDAAWQPLQPIDFDYNIFFQALRADTGGSYQVVAQLDRQPLDDLPATQWQPGHVYTATYTLELPVDPTAITLRYYFGFYDWRDGRRLPVNLGVEDKVILYGE